MVSSRRLGIAFAVICLVAAPACSRRKKPDTTPQPAPTIEAPAAVTPAPPPPRPGAQRVEDLQPTSPALSEDSVANRSLDELNRDSPLRPAFFVLDSSDLDEAGRSIVTGNVEVLKKYPQWVVTIEGHCDERGTAEYNLALGERRASAVKTYMVSLGIAPDRLRTVSYGKEFPFDQAHTEDAWSQNRRAHFVITAK
ncbi:MAG TPA: peptidoglycan-associated lipoprotein Pal [Vicinamibacterales bacterium]|jgi:peptidoglycan-associated lipoprotein|nr:peptidoglycan-associated lipoprotein Pal [Vicinamibacterales bacterium]